jgi:hypothetical protein
LVEVLSSWFVSNAGWLSGLVNGPSSSGSSAGPIARFRPSISYHRDAGYRLPATIGQSTVNLSPQSWLDQLIGVCFSLLLGAAAIYLAVQLLEAVWQVLLVILGIIGAAGIGIAVLRARNQGW